MGHPKISASKDGRSHASDFIRPGSVISRPRPRASVCFIAATHEEASKYRICKK